MTQEKPNAPLCWFCGLRPPDRDSASKWDMYKETREEEGPVTSIAAPSWETTTVPVPRCAECKRAHDRREVYVEKGWKVGLLFGLAALVAVYASGVLSVANLLLRPWRLFITVPVIVFPFAIAGGILAWLLGGSSVPRGVKDQSVATLHPNIKGMEGDGWKIGTKPMRV
jgi:hypothetical protein